MKNSRKIVKRSFFEIRPSNSYGKQKKFDFNQQDTGCAVSLLALTTEYPTLVFRVNTRGRSTTLQYSSTELKSPRGSDEGANGPSDGDRDGGRV